MIMGLSEMNLENIYRIMTLYYQYKKLRISMGMIY